MTEIGKVKDQDKQNIDAKALKTLTTLVLERVEGKLAPHQIKLIVGAVNQFIDKSITKVLLFNMGVSGKDFGIDGD